MRRRNVGNLELYGRKRMKEGFHIEAELVFVSDWKKHLIERGDNRKLVVKKVFEIKRIK